jgi:fatty-acyl-CoA synthase
MHGAGHIGACGSVLLGQTVVITSVVDRLDPVDFWTLVEREKVTLTTWVGEAFARPLVTELETGRHDASSLQLISSGGAALSDESKRRLLEALPTVVCVELAGSSESGPALRQIGTSRSPLPERAVFTAGPGVAVLDDERTRLLPPGHSGTGWFALSGRIPLGYLGDPEKTAATFVTVDGVRYSVPGDRVRLRADGSVELLGRDSVTVNSGGEKIFVEEVEAALLRHPAVVDVVVAGRPSERWGQEVVAIVELTSPAPSDDELLEAAAATIARYKLPKAIVRVPKVVRSPAGKADYRWAASIAAGADASVVG